MESLPNDSEWRKFRRAISALRHGGQVYSEEGRGGEFRGGIESIKIWRRNGGGISVECSWSARNRGYGWKAIPEASYLAHFNGTLPRVKEDGSLSFYIYMIGTAYLYPPDHPKTFDPRIDVVGMLEMYPGVLKR
jgi:hypothetical protein